MIGSAIRKFAQARNLKCDSGFAYGEIKGCQIALDEGSGFKRLWIYLYPSTTAPERAATCDAQALDALQDCDQKGLRLTRKDSFAVGGGFARLTFADGMGTMKRVELYIDEVLPRLAALKLGGNCCASCGEPLNGDVHYVAFNGFVMPVHSGCSRAVVDQAIIEENEGSKRGNALLGLLGALVGAVAGAIPWAVVFMLGYMSSVVGLLIGVLSNALYGAFGGRKSYVRIPIVLLALVVGVVLGQAGGYTLDFNKSYSSATGMGRVEFITACWENYLIYDQETLLSKEYDALIAQLEPGTDMDNVMTREQFVETYQNANMVQMQQEMRGEFGKNALTGLAFGLVGCVGLFGQMGREARDRKARELA